MLGFADGPLWANCFGIGIGCLIGIAVPRAILRDSATSGLNKIAAKSVLLGTLDDEELKAIEEGKETLFDFKVRRLFAKIDYDGNGVLDRSEIKRYLTEIGGPDFDVEGFEEDLNNNWNFDEDGDSST